MNIQSAIFVDEKNQTVAVTADDGVVRAVPTDPANRHWREVQKWVDAGNIIAPYVAPKKPTPAEEVGQRLTTDKTLKALIGLLADKFGMTKQQIIAAIKAKAG